MFQSLPLMNHIVKQRAFGDTRCWMYWIVKTRPAARTHYLVSRKNLTKPNRLYHMRRDSRWKHIVVDNSWIVPYSPLISKTFKTHRNVEYCYSVKSIKCICKYVIKWYERQHYGCFWHKILEYQRGNCALSSWSLLQL